MWILRLSTRWPRCFRRSRGLVVRHGSLGLRACGCCNDGGELGQCCNRKMILGHCSEARETVCWASKNRVARNVVKTWHELHQIGDPACLTTRRLPE